MIKIIGFDADETLWRNEDVFERAHEGYRRLLARYHLAAEVDRFLETASGSGRTVIGQQKSRCPAPRQVLNDAQHSVRLDAGNAHHTHDLAARRSRAPRALWR